MSPARLRPGTLAGILCALAGNLLFSLNDVAFKFLSGDYPLHQLVLIRGLVALAVVVGVLIPLEGGWHLLRTRRPFAHLLRGLCVVVSNTAFFLALATLPLADAVGLFFVTPLLITALSVPLLGERVGPRRWAAVAVGFVGVLVMLRPGGRASRRPRSCRSWPRPPMR